MKRSQLKSLLKSIILEIQKNEMIVNKDYPPDVMGAVNVENISEDIDPKLGAICASELIAIGQGEHAKLVKYCNDIKELHSYLRDRVFGKDITTAQFVQKCIDQWKTQKEQTGTGAVGGTMTPAWGRKKKLKEKTLPDGRYIDDMEDGRKTKRFAGMTESNINFDKDRYAKLKKAYNDAVKQGKQSFVFDGQEMLTAYAKYALECLASHFDKKVNEMTTSSAAGGQEGGTIRVPAWGTKNKLGSPGAIAATKKMKGWKIAKSITDEGK